MPSAWLAVIAAIMLVVATAPFLMRTHYRIDDAGVRLRRGFVTRTRRWTELRRLEDGRVAALVSPYAQRRWLDRYRDLTIYFDGSDRAAVVRVLEARLGASCGRCGDARRARRCDRCAPPPVFLESMRPLRSSAVR